MDMNKMIDALKKNPGFHKMGMIACHLGVVRETSLEGKKVKEIEVTFDSYAIKKIVNDTKEMPGIVEVIVELSGGRLEIGDEIMAVLVGGDRRENVFPALIAAVDRIKKEGSKKKEFFL